MNHLQLDFDRHIATVTLNRPQVRNAFNDELIAELTAVAGRNITQMLVDRTVEGIADIRASNEGREGIQAFLGKRKPSWQTPG